MRNYLYLCLLVWTSALAEPLVSTNNLLTSDVGFNVLAEPLDGAGNAITALRIPVVWSNGQSSIKASFPASPTPYMFTGVHIWYRVEKGSGITLHQPQQSWGDFDHIQAAKAVPAGVMMDCVYQAPLTIAGDLTCNPAVIAPPPPPGASPDGTKINATTPKATVIDSAGVVWGILPMDLTSDHTNSQTGISRNGVRVSRAVDYLIWRAGKICQQDIVNSSTPNSKTCECWSNGWLTAPLAACQ